MELLLSNPNYKCGEIQDFLPKQRIINLFSSLKDGFEHYLSSFIDDCVKQSIKEHSSTSKPISSTSKPIIEDELYLTTKEACKLLKISPTTLWRWTEDGRITKHYVFGNPRFLKQEVLSKVKSVTPKN
ncbi:MAG: helix-turn-helix domain-containing protein [Xanthomarina gelatinilytica]|uniref:helix-turn-helix domain-containing protein n=1 Tax=Xanthomarina gelatinilytica TaxID=1137281 RepID=UPI003A87FE7B